MALVADLDSLDLVVNPHHLTAEEAAEISQFIKEHREKHPLTEEDKREIQRIVDRIHNAGRAVAQP